MQFPLSQITTFVLLIHMVLGCCAHHTHGCENDCCAAPTAIAEVCPCGEHEHGDVAGSIDRAGDSYQPATHGDRHNCAGDACTFVESRPTWAPTDEGTSEVRPLEFVAVPADLHQAPEALALGQHRFHAGISVRGHLALRVLLI